MSDRDSKSSRIAIQLGKPPSTSSSPHGIKKRARPAHGKRHRAGALQEDSESEDNSDNDQQAYGRVETITSFDLPGANLDDEEPATRGGSLGHDARGLKGEKGDAPSDDTDHHNKEDSRPRGDGSKGDAAAAEAQDKPVKWGLTINMKGAGAKNAAKRESSARASRAGSEEDSSWKGKAAKSIDDEALEALAGTRTPKRKHIDSDAADRDPRPEDYQSVPIDDFGAHLLRGFGWDGKMNGKVKEVTRHANLTGLGARDVKGAEDLGAWNQKTTKDSRPVRLDDYRREESKKRQRVDDRRGDSYKREREREREHERRRERDR